MEKHKHSTVKDLIAHLQTMPQDAVVYMRPKYSAPLEYYKDYELVEHQIYLMNPAEAMNQPPKGYRPPAQRFGKKVKIKLNKKANA